MNIYQQYEPTLHQVMDDLLVRIEQLNQTELQHHQPKLYEHLISRIKTPSSMVEKCQRKGYPVTTKAALRQCKDAIGIRIVCNFIDDIDRCLTRLHQADWCQIVNEKDYITNAKPNGYRSYHVILDVTTPYRDIDGHLPGHYFAELQLRTIAMDSWASLEHEMKYKHHIHNSERIGKELKRCADQLASCDVQMQTIRQLINESD
ncbi:GTP pyrophosphokinase family protein [uncultured Limosilactobacillus sp.]|uniref:GTP pyrophosphokinase n=1 Tax=uncultured Limosilactobacillus sp. TaxID=2837629 RepID=UPI0025E6B90E|nr:GTP pyrophosphokinase family protein [uncultured Limosilactobacillus sp.]